MAEAACRYRSGLQHWHPLLRSTELGHQPLRRQLCGEAIVVFRTASGQPAALHEVCPHRRMSLAAGQVRGEQLVCAYHGWRFDRAGQVQCPLMPAANIQQPSFQVREAHGLIWVREPQPGETATPALPRWPVADQEPAGVTVHTVPAPLELTLDNFSETEHTTTIHQVFGFRSPAEVELKMELEPGAIKVWNSGPQQPFPRLFDPFIDIRPRDRFANDWVTSFEPPFSVYEQTWRCGEQLRRFRLRVVMFFLPLNDTSTQLTTLLYTARVLPGPLHRWFAAPIARWITAYELQLDVKALAQLADLNPQLCATTLGPFDKVLVENRRRLQALYLKH